MQKADILVTDFGNVNIPSSALLKTFQMMAEEMSKQSFLERLLFGKHPNPAQDVINDYFSYVNIMGKMAWEENDHGWQVDVLSFDEWLKVR